MGQGENTDGPISSWGCYVKFLPYFEQGGKGIYLNFFLIVNKSNTWLWCQQTFLVALFNGLQTTGQKVNKSAPRDLLIF